jgi:superkiller protein 3
LDWIVMKALEKDRNRRYETANGFAMDVQRYLADEPVLACPPSVGYRFGKFARRNKVALAFAGLVLLILLTLTGGIGWNVRDRAARQAAVEQEVNLALKEAEQLQEQAKWPEALLAAKHAEGLLAGGGSDELRERVYQLRKDLEMVLRLEEIPLLWSEWKTGQFDYETADRAYARAFGDYGMNFVGLPADEAGARLRARAGVAVALVAALDDWAYVRSQKDKSGGLALTALAQEADPDPWRRQVRQAVLQKDTKALAALAASPGLLRQPPTSLLVLARAMRAGNLADAQIEVLRQAQRQYPGDFWINFKLAMVLGKTGSPYRDEAISFYRAALAVRPRSTAVHNNVGLALKDQGMLDEAIASYRKAIELDPRFAMAHNNLGLALQAQGKLDEAIAAYHKAISFDPKYVDAHNNFGNALRAQGKLPEATVAYEKAIELDPKFAMAHYNLGNVLYDQKMLVAAIAAYDKAIELDPIYAVAHTNLGLALNAQGKRDEAIASLRKAIEIDPKIAAAHTNLGLTLKAQGKLDEAIASLRKAIEIDPQHAVAHNNLGWALKDQGKLDEAIASFHKAIELDPKIAVAHNNLAWILANQGKLDEAIAILRKLIELDPRSAVNRYNLAVLLSRQGKLDEAIAAYHKAIELDPKYAQAYNGLAWLLATCPDARFRDQKQAVELAKKAVELAPKAGIFWSTLGVANYGAGAWKDAVATLEKSMELREGGNSVDCFVLAMAHAKLNDKEAARQWYDKAVAWMDKNQPKDEALRRLRAEAAELLGIEKKKD